MEHIQYSSPSKYNLVKPLSSLIASRATRSDDSLISYPFESTNNTIGKTSSVWN